VAVASRRKAEENSVLMRAGAIQFVRDAQMFYASKDVSRTLCRRDAHHADTPAAQARSATLMRGGRDDRSSYAARCYGERRKMRRCSRVMQRVKERSAHVRRETRPCRAARLYYAAQTRDRRS